MKYERLSDLPLRVQRRVVDLARSNPEEWVLKPIPALENRSIIDIMNSDEGEERVAQFLLRLEGMLGG
jgi:uncharacterized protein (DUF2384 family)